MPKISKETEAWFDYPDDPSMGRVLIRHIKQGEAHLLGVGAIKRQTVYNKDNSDWETVVDIDSVKSVTDTAVASIVSWENFSDETGKSLECTPENIGLFMLEPGFVDFVTDCRSKIDEKVKKGKETDAKN